MNDRSFAAAEARRAISRALEGEPPDRPAVPPPALVGVARARAGVGDELERHTVQVRMRGRVMVQGDLHMPPRQSLAAFLATKKTYLNLTSARWLDQIWSDEVMHHLSVHMEQIQWVMPMDLDVRLSSAASPMAEAREVELHLVGGDVLRVSLRISSELRMSDYFEANTSFLPLWDVKGATEVAASNGLLIHPPAIMAIREV